MQKKTLGCLTAALVVALLVSLLFNLSLLVSSSLDLTATTTPTSRPKYQEEMVETGGDKKIAHIDLDGVITNFSRGAVGGTMVDSMKVAIRQAVNDPAVTAIVLRINSPGGEVTASDVLFNEVKKADAIKPVVVYMDSVAASGGYYIACGARKILANETTMTGSIGVILSAPNYTELMGKIGLDMVVFKSGKFKDTLRGSREIREDEREFWQGHIDESYEKFLGIVAEARGLEADSLRDDVADGRIFSGAKAAGNGLVDGTGYIEDAYEEARILCGVGDASIVRYRALPSLASLFSILGEAPGAKRIEIGFPGDLVPDVRPGHAYYLPPSFLR